MTDTATIRRVPRPRGELTEKDEALLASLMLDWRRVEARQAGLKTVIVGMVARSSFRAVSEATGFSTNTLQRWKREAGK